MAKNTAKPSSTKPSTTRKLRVKDTTSDVIVDQGFPINIEPEKHDKKFFAILIVATALISSLFTFGFANQLSPGLAERTTLAAQTSGGVCLSEKELRTLISENKIAAYWTGPVKDATYSINATTPGQVFIRYILKGMDCGSTEAKFRVIATYAETDAYNSTLQAGNQAEGVSLSNPDGSVVYFSKNAPNNVYVAYPNLDYQVEIYDPDAKTAVTLATTSNQVQLIKG
jgi:hypothetical protein